MRAVALLLLVACGHREPPPVAAPAVISPRTLTVTSDVPLAVTVLGPDTAPATLVVVTGGPGLSHDYAMPLGALASEKLRVAFYDQRGTGKSGRPPPGKYDPDPNRHTLAHHVADLEAIRVALRADKLHLLGHSWGSLPVQHYAIAHPDRVASMIILNGIPPTGVALEAGLTHARLRKEKLQAEGLIPTVIPEPKADGDCSSIIPLTPNYYADPRHRPGRSFAAMTCHDVGFATFVLIDSDFDNRAALGAIEVPVLVMTGDGDLFGTGWADDFVAAMPGARKVIAPRCGHFLWDECPDVLFRELRAFLAI